ncbi:MAG: hypothetical protein LBT69_02485 [Lactobacillales bacterium]|jgi:YbbR domain-containing protein|nr:hypothetical protein [Lactobacillales bacterium]
MNFFLFNKHKRLYFFLSFIIALILFVNANLMNQQKNTVSEQLTERYDVTLHNVPIEVKINEKKFYAYGYDTEVEVHLSSYNRIKLETEESEATRLFKVVADFSNLAEGTHEVPLRVEGLNDSVDANVETPKISVTIDKKVTAKLEVRTKINEEQLSTGFSLGKVRVDPEKLEIVTGERLLNLIDHLEVELPPTVTLDHDYSEVLPVKALDFSNKPVSIRSIPTEVGLNIEVYKPSKQVSLQLVQQGTLGKDVMQVQMFADVEKVQISGLKREIDKVDVLRLPIDVTDITDKKVYYYELPHLLYSVEPKKVKVTVVPILKSEITSGSS